MRLRATMPLALILVTAAPAWAGDKIGEATKALNDPRWEVRRRAESDLFEEGRHALAAADAPTADAAQAALKAWSDAIGACIDGGSPTAAAAAERCVKRLEVVLDDATVKRDPRLLRARLDRLLPQAVESRVRERGRGAFGSSAGSDALLAIAGLLPEAMPVLLAIVETSTDARRTAGAIAALAGSARTGPADDAVLHRIAQAWLASPERMEAIADYTTDSSDAHSPLALVGLALAVEGRVREAVACVSAGAMQIDTGILNPLAARLKAAGRGDLTYGRFLVNVFEGRLTAADLVDAARTALGADLPWVARLTARRALFLEPESAEARRLLVSADRALGLERTAREDSGDAAATPGSAEDDRAARAIDQALRAGTLGQRLTYRKEAGSSRLYGVVPIALGNGVIAYGVFPGRMMVADAATGTERTSAATHATGLPRAAAISGTRLAAVSARAELLVWSLSGETAKEERRDPGPWSAVAAAPGGGFYAAGPDRTFSRFPPEGDPTFLPTTAEKGFRAVSLGVLADGRLIAATLHKVVVVDPKTGDVTTAAEEPMAILRAATLGNDVLVVSGLTYARLAADGKERWRKDTKEGSIVGVAGDVASKTVYLAIAHELLACDADDGSPRWADPVEGSGSPSVGEGLVAVPAGSGGFGGDNRDDRTISVLRGSGPLSALFEPASRLKVLEAAEAAARNGHPLTAEMLVDPLLDWFPDDERSRLEDLLGR